MELYIYNIYIYLYFGGCQNPGSHWVNNLFIFLMGTLLTFIIHCYSVLVGPNLYCKYIYVYMYYQGLEGMSDLV